MRRFYIDPARIRENEAVIDGPDVKHIKTVLRLKPGDTLIVLDGKGAEYTARISAFEEDRVCVSVRERFFPGTESPVAITIAQGFLKDKKMDPLVRQLTELGITTWVPFFAERSVSRPPAKRLQGRIKRWEKITRESVKQCRRSRALNIHPVLSYEEMLQMGNSADIKIIFWEEEAGGSIFLTDAALHSPGPKIKTVFAVFGPEGGLTDSEIKKAKQYKYITVGLGPRILRAETATIAGAALLQSFFGDMEKNGLT